MKNKKVVLLGFVLLFLSISIGYAYLTKNLNINGVTGVKKVRGIFILLTR